VLIYQKFEFVRHCKIGSFRNFIQINLVALFLHSLTRQPNQLGKFIRVKNIDILLTGKIYNRDDYKMELKGSLDGREL